MAIQTLSSRLSLDTLGEELVYTLARLRAYTNTAKYVSSFETLLSDLKKTKETEMSLQEKILSAEALIDSCDDELDECVDKFSNILLTLTQNNRSDLLYQRYFGSIRPSDLKKPVLGEELETVRGWLDSLKSSTHKELQEVGTSFEEIVTRADKALTSLRELRTKYTDFRTLGAREQFFARANAERKSIYGELNKLAHSQRDLQASSFADRFFLHRRVSKRADPESSAEIREHIDEIETTLKEWHARYESALAREAEAAKKQQDYELKLQALEAAERDAQKAMQHAAELRKQLGR